MKYIVAQNEESEQNEIRIFIFEKGIDHDKFGITLGYGIRAGTRSNWWTESWRPISAGFTDGNTCYGRSETLNLDSDPIRDTNLLNGRK